MNFAYWCILLAALLPWLCAAYAKHSAGFRSRDNHNPRAFLAQAHGAAARANAAQQNGFEIFPLFAAAVLIAHATGNADQSSINTWALLFVLSRCLYCWLYISDRPSLRSLVWGLGLLCILALFAVAV